MRPRKSVCCPAIATTRLHHPTISSTPHNPVPSSSSLSIIPPSRRPPIRSVILSSTIIQFPHHPVSSIPKSTHHNLILFCVAEVNHKAVSNATLSTRTRLSTRSPVTSLARPYPASARRLLSRTAAQQRLATPETMDPPDIKRSSTSRSTSKLPSASATPFVTATPPSVTPADDDPPTPRIEYKGVKSLYATIIANGGDSFRVDGITPEVFTSIFRSWSEYRRWRLFYCEPRRVLLITVPHVPHELAGEAFADVVKENIAAMGLRSELYSTNTTTHGAVVGQHAAGSADPDKSFTPFSSGNLHPWPSLIVETGLSKSMADLRLKASWWLQESNYAVKAVIIIKIRIRQLTITLEKWVGARQSDRPGATGTRSAAALRPQRAQSIEISRPGVGPHSDARLDPGAYVVARGDLRLGFTELFLRDPRPDERDVIFTEEVLREFAAQVWVGGP